jgi:hypothetical protein
MARARKDAEHRLYDPTSGRFYVRNGEWTDDESQASSFRDLVSVVQLCLRYGIKDAQMLVQVGRGPRRRVAIFA